MNKFDDAAATIREMFDKFPGEKSVTTLTFLAEYQRRAGHSDAAKATLAEAMKLDANDPDAQIRLASVLSDSGQLDDAVGILRTLSKREPNNPAYDRFLGFLLSRFGRNEEAIKVLDDLLRRHGNNPDVVKSARALLSVAYVNMGNYPKGEAELEMLLQADPEDPGTNNDLGYLYAEQGKNLERAESMIQKALEQAPENTAYLDSMGWVLYKRGKFKEALETMKKAVERMTVERGEPDSTILEHIGDVYFQLQQADKAEDSWQQALKAAEDAIPPDKRAGEIRKKLEALRKLGPKAKTSSSPSP